ncbi:MAG: YwaF family protein [Verrucomicrobia bacterium]|nr:YwaF family protein [Verrucomicrobiota bacterium]
MIIFLHAREVSFFIILLLFLATAFLSKKSQEISLKVLAVWLILELFLNAIFLEEKLPLHICNIMQIAIFFAVFRRAQLAYEMLLFIGFIGGALAALRGEIPLDRGDVMKSLYLFGHSNLVFFPIALTFYLKMRPRPKAWWAVVLSFIPLTIFVTIFDDLFDKNYMFLRTPVMASPFIWPWPYYILQGFLGYLGTSFLLSRVFRAVDKKERLEKRALLLTIAGGGGHLEAAKAKMRELAENYPGIGVLQKDLFLDFLPLVGKPILSSWNRSQVAGKSASLSKFFSKVQKIGEYLMGPLVFFLLVRFLEKNRISVIIDTQAFGTRAIIRAIRYMRWWHGQEIYLEKSLTELPTKEFNFFAESIRNLSLKDRAFLKLRTTEPLLEEGERDGSFWQKYYSLSLSSVLYGSLPVRASFLKYSDPKVSERELTVLLEEGPFLITAHDKVALILLGSNPDKKAVKGYIEEFLLKAKGIRKGGHRHILLIFCSKQEDLKEEIKEIAKRAENLIIVPLGYQKEEVTAALLHRADLTLTRSGGLTSMELLLVSRGQILIHKGEGSVGMPVWEFGNFSYLEAKKNAALVTPKTLLNFNLSYFDR